MPNEVPETPALALPISEVMGLPYPVAPSDYDENPGGGRVAIGAAVGSTLGLLVGIGAARLFFGEAPSDTAEVTGETREEVDAAADASLAQLRARYSGWDRKRKTVVGIFSTLGAAAGASAAADEGEKGRAAVGASVGTGLAHMTNVVAQPSVSLPGIGTAALGATLALKAG